MIRLSTIILLLLFICASDGFSADESQPSQVNVSIPGLTGKVNIYRDNYGTPYIIAENSHDLYIAHGYVQAMDRLFQLDGIRRIPKAQTAQLVGDDQLSMDMWFARLGLDRTAALSLEKCDPETREALQLFADGVNAYLKDSSNKLPLEFQLLGYKPEPWTPQDSLCVIRLVSWWLSVGLNEDLAYQDLVGYCGKDIASKLYPGVPSRDEIDKAVAEKRKTTITEVQKIVKPFKPFKWRYPVPRPPRGTNCWVVSGSKTKSGKPILANDPHLELFSPSIWYEIGLSCPEWTMVGVVFPGLPIPQIGTNGYVAWGAAAFPADTQDIYREILNPKNDKQYKYNGKWRDYKVSEKQIPTKDGTQVTVQILEGVHGPVIQTDEKENLSLAWTGFDPSDDLSAFTKAVKAKNVDQLKNAFKSFTAIPQHFFAFDLDGNIAHLQPGRLPIRKGFNGDLILDGSDPRFDWSGFIPYDLVPVEKNPPVGFANNSNNFPPIDSGFDLGRNFPLPSRYNRVRELLLPKNDFTIEDMAAMQMDVLNPVAREILPLMLGKLGGADYKGIENEVELLENWDYNESAESVAATIYNQWWIELPKVLFNQKLGIYATGYRDTMDQCTLAMIDILKNGESSELFKWAEIGNQDNLKLLCATSLKTAVSDLTKAYGTDKAKWQWGNVHLAHFAHPSGVKFLVDGGSYGVGGSRYTLKVTHYFPSSGYEATFGVSYRFIASIDDKGRIVAQSVLPPGNWAAPLSGHFKDQIPMWCDGGFKKLCVFEDDMRKLPLDFVLNP